VQGEGVYTKETSIQKRPVRDLDLDLYTKEAYTIYINTPRCTHINTHTDTQDSVLQTDMHSHTYKHTHTLSLNYKRGLKIHTSEETVHKVRAYIQKRPRPLRKRDL